MSKIERLKEELAIQKQLFFLAIALVIGILGWLSTNIGTFPWWIGIGGLTAIVFASLFAYSRYMRMKQLLQEIEDA